MIRRRKFIGAVVGGLLAAPVAVDAQQAAKPLHVIGWLHSGGAFGSSFDALRLGLSELGWIEGRNIAIVARGASNDPASLAALAAELAALGVEAIVTNSTSSTLAARRATTRIPIVMAGAGGSDGPVELGLAKSLARPGGNVTGLTNIPDRAFIQKTVQILKEAAPKVSRLAVLWNPGGAGELKEIHVAASALGLTVIDAEVRAPEQLRAALAAALQARADGLYGVGGPINSSGRIVVEWARANRLPSIAADDDFAFFGGLLSYAADWNDLRRRSASYVDKILRGADPAELAIEQPAKFKLVINLKTANAIGIVIPQSLLVRANEVIR